MNIKMGKEEPIQSVFLDIDGTLLNPNHELSDENIATVRKLREIYSIPVYLISARPPSGIREYYDKLGLNTPFTAYNGAITGSFTEGLNFTAERNVRISSFFVPDLWKESELFPFTFCIYEGNTLYVKDLENIHAQREKRLTHCNLEVLDIDFLSQSWKLNNSGPHKIQCIGRFEEVNPFLDIIKAKNYASELHIKQSGDLNFEITHFGATKEDAVKSISEKTAIPLEEIMALGDNYNDVATLNMVGIGIAMGNAPQEILDQVKIHTSRNTENGVAEALKKYFPKLTQ